MSTINSTEAIDFHSEIAEKFHDRYKKSKDFIERFEVWNEVFKTYLKPEQRILDAGCGSGVLSFHLASKGHNVIGVDGSSEMINICEKVNANELMSNLAFYRMEIPQELSENTIGEQDVVVLSSVLEYVSNIENSLEVLSSLVVKGGLMIISMPNKSSIYRNLEKIFFQITKKPKYFKFVVNRYSEVDFTDIMNKHGYELIEVKYYGTAKFILRKLKNLLRPQLTNNLFVGVYKRNG